MAGEPSSCPDSVSAFCASLAWGDCPEIVNGAVREECPLNADYATYTECDGGVVSYAWRVGGDHYASMVFNESGELIYGTSYSFGADVCTVGTAPSFTDCKRCLVCEGDTVEGFGGQGGAPSQDPCNIDSDGFVSLP